jgi:TatD DNase family protein
VIGRVPGTLPVLIDSHCHLADPAFSTDLEAVVSRARAAGVSRALCVLEAGDAAEAAQAERLAEMWTECRFAVGVHPHMARDFAGRLDRFEAWVREALKGRPPACAIGEIGLDYHYDLSPREVQRELFRAQVRLARDVGLPVVVHTRKAEADTISILQEEGGGEIRGVLHCFSGSADLASAALDLGFAVSFAGMLTFPNAADLRRVAALIPADRLLTETDCPYLAPAPHRGRRNEPAWVVRVLETLAEVRGERVEELARAVDLNFTWVFGG